MIRIEFQPAYILHRRPYRETSILLDFFTPDYGRISAIGKGVRRPNSSTKALLQPFVPLLISCAGRGDLLTLKDFDANGPMSLLSGRRIMSAFYMNEILMRLIQRQDANPGLFQQYQHTLEALSSAQNEQVTLRLFEKALLQALGYELQLTKDYETGHAVEENNSYLFDPERGPTLVQSKGKTANIFTGKTLLALAQGSLEAIDVALLNDAKRLMRLALAPHLGIKPLASRRLFT